MLDNTWIGYFDRTYEQIRNKVLTEFQSLVPEMTDHTDGNTYVKMLNVFAGIGEMLGYYIDNNGREALITKCRLYRTAVALANGYDYRIKSRIASTGVVKLTLNATYPVDLTIPAGTTFSTDDGITFTLLDDAIILANTLEINGNVAQYSTVTGFSLGTSNGTDKQSFELPLNVYDLSLYVEVGGNPWTSVVTFAESIFNSEHCKQTVRQDKTPVLVFGDGFNGVIPPAGDEIVINYKSTLGSAGNVAPNTIVNVGYVSLPSGYSLSVTNVDPTTNGEDIESIDSIKRSIVLHNRTNFRAVTEQDHIDIAELYGGVARAGVSYSCGKIVTIYCVPDGGGIASPTLLNGLKFHFENETGMIGKRFRCLSAGQIRVKHTINIKLRAGYQASDVVADLTARLLDFYSYSNQRVNGSVQLGDVYEVIENTTGVSFSSVQIMKPLPYATPLFNTTNVLTWTFNTSNVTSIQSYKIKMLSGGIFNVFKNNVFVGNGTIGVLFTDSDISFTITGSYSVNDQWSFKLYPNGSFNLDEPSIPTLDVADLTINVSN